MKKMMSESLKKKAKEKSDQEYKKNPAMPKKKRNLPVGNKRSKYMEEMQDKGME